MENKATLLIMAAGMGSRFGGLKQIEPMGPNGEILLDFSVFDAKKAGFDWEDAGGAFDALRSELAELEEAKREKDFAAVEDELGDVLFSAVNVARFLGVDSEEALTKASNKFLRRYLIVEKLAKERNIDMKATPIEELDKLWAEAKKSLESN